MNVNKILDQWKSSRMVWKSYVASLTLKQSCKIFGQNTSAGHIKSFRPKQCCSIFPGDNQSVMTGFNVFQIKISWKYEFLERRNVSHFSSGVSNGDIYIRLWLSSLECIMQEMFSSRNGILMLCGRHVYIRCKISYSLSHKSV